MSGLVWLVCTSRLCHQAAPAADVMADV